MSTSSTVSNHEAHSQWAAKLTKCFYQDDQQAKLMHLQAEVDSLLEQLQSLKMQRLGAIDKD